VTRVLVVDDEPQILRALRINLSARGYEVSTAVDGASALRAAAERSPEVVVPAAWGPSTVRKLALRPSNVADRVHRGVVIGRGNWPALVDRTWAYPTWTAPRCWPAFGGGARCR